MFTSVVGKNYCNTHLSGGFGIQSAADRLFLFPPEKTNPCHTVFLKI